MQDERNLHLKLQEMIDCYANTDYLKELSEVQSEEQSTPDLEQEALKWLALIALHGINNKAKKISLNRKGDELSVMAEYYKTDLPTPGANVGNQVFDTLRSITHIEEDKGSIPLSLGVRDSSVNLEVKVKRSKDKEKVSIKFPSPGDEDDT